MKFSNIQTGSGSQQLSCLLAFQPSTETKAHSLCKKRSEKGEKNLKRVISIAMANAVQCLMAQKNPFSISEVARRIKSTWLSRRLNGGDSHPLLESILMAFFALYNRPHYSYSKFIEKDFGFIKYSRHAFDRTTM